jgi:hypothetical protein
MRAQSCGIPLILTVSPKGGEGIEERGVMREETSFL